MKKLLSATLIALLSLTLITGCSSGEPGAPDGMKTASPAGVDYTLYVPSDWAVDTSEGSILTSAHVKDGDNSNITMMSYTNDSELTTIVEFWESHVNRLATIFDLDEEGNSTYKLLTVGGTDSETGEAAPDGEAAELNGQPCRVYRFEGLIGGIPLRYMQVISYYKGDFYVFTYTATTENDRYGRNEEDVARILNEFKFK